MLVKIINQIARNLPATALTYKAFKYIDSDSGIIGPCAAAIRYTDQLIPKVAIARVKL